MLLGVLAQGPFDLLPEAGPGVAALKLRDHLTGAYDGEGRQGADTEQTGRDRVLVHIDHDEFHPTGELARDLVYHRGHLAAGAAPLGPEVYDDRQVAPGDLDVVGGVGDGKGGGHKYSFRACYDGTCSRER